MFKQTTVSTGRQTDLAMMLSSRFAVAVLACIAALFLSNRALAGVGVCCGSIDGSCILAPDGTGPCPTGTYFYGAVVCSPNSCPQPTACCNTTTGACSVVAPMAACPTGTVEGSPLTSTCTGGLCPQPGTCCTSSLGCSFILQSFCASPNLWSEGGACSPLPCVLSGRCCNFFTGACTFALQSVCGLAAHTWTFGGMCSPNTCDVPGACCDTSLVCIRRTQVLCVGSTVTWMAGVCSPTPCTLNGRCCNFITGACTLALESVCGPAAHTWVFGGTCSPNTCDQPGACCDTSLICRRRTETQCVGSTVAWTEGVCSPTPCTLNGRCCNFITGACTLAHESVCGLASHTWAFGGTCSPNTCDVPGACCDATTVCRRRTHAQCTGGVFGWSAGSCTPNPCAFFAREASSACPADFNHSGSVNTADIFDYLSAWFVRDPRADFNGDGAVNVSDTFAFLSAWFANCP